LCPSARGQKLGAGFEERVERGRGGRPGVLVKSLFLNKGAKIKRERKR
jgi:hypothetical protein